MTLEEALDIIAKARVGAPPTEGQPNLVENLKDSCPGVIWSRTDNTIWEYSLILDADPIEPKTRRGYFVMTANMNFLHFLQTKLSRGQLDELFRQDLLLRRFAPMTTCRVEHGGGFVPVITLTNFDVSKEEPPREVQN